MRNSHANNKSGARRTVVLIIALCIFVALPLLSNARVRSNSINVVNNSSREIINLYLSHANQDDWGSDLLSNATLTNGQSFTISNVSCDEAQIKVVAEDANGCFLSAVVSCGDAVTWTITNDTAADCGY
jgi:hypothetical protein